ncbi:MAG: type II toxin-antitoxin system VapC family toxin [Terracidiphilus sp.]
MIYLLDTNVVSELRSRRNREPDARVAAWAQSIAPSSLYLSVISILEIEMGVLQKQRSDPKQAAVLRAWLESHVLPSFAGRILAVDTAIAKRCASLHVPDPCSYRDSLIAATALVHGMTVVTRNVFHFQRTGVAVFDPWQA